MKTLLIVRHAKSSWEAAGQNDIDRPLNERGKKDAPEMAKRLKKRGIKVDTIISSTATRAKKTANYFAEEYGFDKKDIVLKEELYAAAPPAFYKVVQELNDSSDTVVIFSHNPGVTDFANTLTNVRIDDMPTCAVFAVSMEAPHWNNFKEAEKKFLFFDYPKNPVG